MLHAMHGIVCYKQLSAKLQVHEGMDAGQVVPAASGPQLPSNASLPSSTAHPQQSMKHLATYLPFQQQQQQLAFSQHIYQPQGFAQHPVQGNQAAQPAARQPKAQELPQPGFTPAAGFQLPPQAQQHVTMAQPNTRQVDWTNQPSHEPAEAAHEQSANQPALEAQKGVADSSLHGTTTSDVLRQQANQWRQAAHTRSALADLIPAAGSQQTSQSVPAMAQSRGHLQPRTDQQGCEAFRPAVQACIAAASLPLAKPFYQQAVERAMEQRSRRRAIPEGREASSVADLKNESMDANANDHSIAEVPGAVHPAASVAHGAGHEHSGGQNAAQQGMSCQQPQSSSQPEAASPAISNDSDLGTDLADEDAKCEARRYISAIHWGSALICGKLQLLFHSATAVIVELMSSLASFLVESCKQLLASQSKARSLTCLLSIHFGSGMYTFYHIARTQVQALHIIIIACTKVITQTDNTR